MSPQLDTFWNSSSSDVLALVQASPRGLTNREAIIRQKRSGAQRLNPKKHSGALYLFFGQFKSPIMIILLVAAVLSYFLHDRTDTVIVLTIVLASGLLGFLHKNDLLRVSQYWPTDVTTVWKSRKLSGFMT